MKVTKSCVWRYNAELTLASTVRDESKLTRLFGRHMNVHVWGYKATESRGAMPPHFE